jgi:hypothetical protein
MPLIELQLKRGSLLIQREFLKKMVALILYLECLVRYAEQIEDIDLSTLSRRLAINVVLIREL